MTTWLAHSAGKNPPVPPQTYNKHISEVSKHALENVNQLSSYYKKGDLDYFREAIKAASIYHDLGKLDDENQKVLSKGGGKGLPINHVDAGTANLLQNDLVESALLVYSHHIGLQSIPNECAKAELFLRDADLFTHTQKHLEEYLSRHNQSIPKNIDENGTINSDWNGLTRRIALSCIVDADHGDTARNYGNEFNVPRKEPRWEERLFALDNYIEVLGKENKQSERNQLRKRIYDSCKEADTEPLFYGCDSPVGTGKTTAVMAHLLKTAIDKKLRHIIVVLPYTNIIKQSVDIYRKALVLPGEKADEIIAEHHHQADFYTLETRQLATLWKAPIIVTTAVQFFETIASNHPSKLRKLNELPGSGIFIDEVHSAIPNHLWPQTWKWMKELSEKWSCYFVLASGSLSRFWELKDMIETPVIIPELIPKELREDSLHHESKRITPITYPSVLNDEELMNLVIGKPGPRLVIMNTIQSAAVFAEKLRKAGHDVLHLSTALAPIHRELIVERIKQKLKYNFGNWTLVATSCVEAGVDFSFRSAFRERASAANLIQVGGRVRRNNEDFEPTLIDFRVEAPLFNRHSGFTLSSQILEKLFEENRVGIESPADLITEALRRELMSDTEEKHKRIQKMETEMDYPEVANLYKVIASDTRLVIVDKTLIDKLEKHEKVDPKEINRNSVQLWSNKIYKLALDFVKGYENSSLYAWPYDYDPDFLGYMAGVLPLLKSTLEGFEAI
ncbi:MAG: DEAD/DEAH box helicase family protein [Bacteroidetes bacterium]|nr:DEAD/DEAH box helicase family protein [Bacteroidota bacterium]